MSKKSMRVVVLLLSMVCLPLWASNTFALPRVEDISKSTGSMEERLSRLESIVQNLSQMLSQMEDMQQEIQRLRGELDENNYKVEKLTKQQKDIYNLVANTSTTSNALSASNNASISPKARSNSIEPKEPATDAGLTYVPSNAQGSNIKVSENRVITIADERGSYQSAQGLLQKRDYAGARKAFEKIVKDYPQGEMIANSFYWLGEINMLEGDLNQSKEWFNKVVSNFPEHPKAPDALYKLGNVANTQGELKIARQFYAEVVRRYPDSPSARLAQSKLDSR